MTSKIDVGHGKYALVDDEDVAMLKKYAWHLKTNHVGIDYASTSLKIGNFHTTVFMHSVISGLSMTDHINGDGLDNRKCNLRRTDRGKNRMNSRKKANASSKYKGVGFSKKGKCWYARALVKDIPERGRRRSYLGSFDNEIDAARAYDAAAREHYGEYAALNFPLPGERSALTGEITPLNKERAA